MLEEREADEEEEDEEVKEGACICVVYMNATKRA